MTATNKIYNNKTQLEIIKACINKNLPALLVGETGTGKTTIIRTLAEMKKQNLTRINLNGQTGREELIGKYILGDKGEMKWERGSLMLALEKGDWILLDEINVALPEVLFILQALLEVRNGKLGNILLSEKDSEVLVPNKNCRIFATSNPSTYAGTKEFNTATLSRFIVVDINPLETKDEMELLKERYKVETEDIIRLESTAETMRELKKQGEIDFFISTRDLEQACLLIEEKIPLNTAIQTTMINKAPTSEELNTIVSRLEDFTITKENIVTLKEMLTAGDKKEDKIKELKKELKKLQGIKELIEVIKK